MDALKAAIAAAQKTYDDAVAALVKAEQEIARLEEEIAKQKAINLAWEQSIPSLLVHEEGHRKICYLYVDELTKLANQFRAYGYAVTSARAKALAEIQFKVQSVERIQKIRNAEAAHQKSYDDKTNHGLQQNLWTEADMQVTL
jgi:Bacterial protein of unknown function (DUF922)